MKIISVVGMPNSGKTSTIVSLIEAIRRQEKKVGTCKTMIDPIFTMANLAESAMRYRRAGSEPVSTRAKGETTFLYPEALPLSKVLERYRECDYVLLEGDYFAPVPRIVCAQDEADALIRMNTRTLAFAGRISEKQEIALPLPCFNAKTEADRLLEYIDQKIPNIMPCSLLDDLLPPVSGVTDDGFSQDDCSFDEKQAQLQSLQVLFEGFPVKLTAAQQNILLSWIKENTNS